MRLATLFAAIAILAGLLALGGGHAMTSLQSDNITGRAEVLAGDEIRIGDQLVRLAGIDALERDQVCSCRNEEGSAFCAPDQSTWACGSFARAALEDLLRPREVVCRRLSRELDGAVVASCTADGEDLAAYMVRQGWALSTGSATTAEAEAARAARRGVWIEGLDMTPEDWRRVSPRG